MNEKLAPAVEVGAAAIAKWLAGAAFTATFMAPAIFGSAVSVTVIVWAPARSRVAEKVPSPLTRVESGGRTTPAERSVVWKCTVPPYAESVFPN